MSESEKMTGEIPVTEARWLSELSGNRLLGSREQLLRILRHQSTTDKVRAILYRTLVRESFADKAFIEIARRSLESCDSTLVSAVVEYLAANDQEWFLHNIGKFIKTHSLSVKRSAIRALQKISPEAAISAIRAMVSSRSSATLHNAISCMTLLPFDIVRDIAFEIAHNCNDTEILSSILLFFQNNPDPENIFILYCLEMRLNREDMAAAVRMARKSVQTTLVERQMISDMSEIQREKQLKSLWQAFERKNCPAATKDDRQKCPDAFAESASWQVNPYFFVLGFVVLIFATVLYSTSISVARLPDRAGPVVNSLAYVEGELVQVEPDYAIIRSDEGHIFHLRPQNGIFVVDEMRGVRVAARLIPYRRTEEGEYRAVCTELRKKR